MIHSSFHSLTKTFLDQASQIFHSIRSPLMAVKNHSINYLNDGEHLELFQLYSPGVSTQNFTCCRITLTIVESWRSRGISQQRARQTCPSVWQFDPPVRQVINGQGQLVTLFSITDKCRSSNWRVSCIPWIWVWGQQCQEINLTTSITLLLTPAIMPALIAS